jgi:aldehyde:ferredoxin oxidoreductase
MMGTNLLIDDPKAVAVANESANRLGIDTISAGAMIGFAMECFEKGWITPD